MITVSAVTALQVQCATTLNRVKLVDREFSVCSCWLDALLLPWMSYLIPLCTLCLMKDTVLLEISNHALVFFLIGLEVSSTFRLPLLLSCSCISFFVNTGKLSRDNMEHFSKFLPSAFLRYPPYLIIVHPSLASMISRVWLWRMRERSMNKLIRIEWVSEWAIAIRLPTKLMDVTSSMSKKEHSRLCTKHIVNSRNIKY